MKRGLAIFICISLILILSVSVVSAGWWSDFWNKFGERFSPALSPNIANGDCISICLNEKCSGFNTRLRQTACLNNDLRKKECEEKCVVENEGPSVGNLGEESLDVQQPTDNLEGQNYETIHNNERATIRITKKEIIPAPLQNITNQTIDCGFYNEMTFEDPFGDATPGAPAYVDIKSLTVRQVGDQVQFVWEGNGPLENDDEQYYFIVLDTDFNSNTGQHWGPVGAEIKIGVSHDADINYFEGTNPEPIKQIWDIPVVFDGNKFYLNIPKSYINSNRFNLYFDTSGGMFPWRDEGSVNEISLQPAQQPIKLVIEADKMVLKNNPPLVAVEKGERRQLKPFIVKGNTKIPVSQNKIKYIESHLVRYRPYDIERIGDVSEIISISSSGILKYKQRPGFVFVNGFVPECGLTTTKSLIVATGTVYGNPQTDDVLAVFPKNYATRESGPYTFGEMMQDYPKATWMWNLGYKLSSQMYGGFKPFNGDKQIYSMIVSVLEPEEPFACGNNNPLQSDPTCFMHSDGSPEYSAPIHEMGHNFYDSKGMSQLTRANEGRMNRPAECIASLPVIYMYKDFTDKPEKYGINRNSYEHLYFQQHLNSDIPTIYPALNDFENKIRSGEISGYFDEGDTFDKVSVFCDFFQLYAYNLTDDTNPYKQEIIPRFLGIFSDRELPEFIDEKSETYFAAAYSAAIGHDMREKLKFWGFTIDDDYFDKIYPMLKKEMMSTVPLQEITLDTEQSRPTVFTRIRDLFRRK